MLSSIVVMAPLTDRQRLHRSRALKAYWRRVRQIARQGNRTVRQARTDYRAVKQITDTLEVSYREAIRVYVESLENEWRSPEPLGEFAFNVRDRDSEQGFGIYDRFRNSRRVCVDVRVVYHHDGRTDPISEFTTSFDPTEFGSDEDAFWKAYFTAVKQGYEGQGIESTPGFEIITLRIFEC